MSGSRSLQLAVLMAALSVGPASAADVAEPEAGSSPVVFPVVIDTPVRNGGQGIKSGDAFYDVTLRSVKAVRIADAYTFKDHPRTLDRRNLSGKDSEITLPAGTILVMAIAKDGELYCTAASEGEDSGMTFYDVGYCARDTDGDGTFDQELVIEPNPWRVRVAYEIHVTAGAVRGTDGPDWRAVKLAYQPITDIPPLRIKFFYNFTKPAGLFSFASKPRAYYFSGMSWPASLIPAPVRDGAGSKGADFYIGAFRSDKFDTKYGVTASDDPGKETEIATPPFNFKLKINPDNTLDAEVKSAIAPGQALLAVAGRHWTVNDYRYQGTIMRLRPFVMTSVPSVSQ